MKLFEFDSEYTVTADDTVQKSWVQVEAPIRVVDRAHGRDVVRPEPTGNLFPIVEDAYTISKDSPIQRQRRLDGTPHAKGPPTALRPPEPELYLSKAFTNPDVPKEASPEEHKYSPEQVVKAFLEG